MALAWYALHVICGAEERIAERLKTAEIEHWLPLEEVWIGGRGRAKGRTELVPYLPGYVLPRLDLAKPHAEIEEWAGVIGLVRGLRRKETDFGIWPSQVADAAVAMLMGLGAHPGGPIPQTPSTGRLMRFQRQQRIRVIEGAYSGWTGKILELRGAERVRALFDGGAHPVTLGVAQLAAV